MSNFRPVDCETGFLMPPSVDEGLPERHLARFVVAVIEGLDLRAMTGDYRGSGEASYHPSVLLGLLVHGYATGMFSSRKPERATYASVSFRFITANQHPDHDTIATFRRRFLKQIATLVVQVLVMAREMGKADPRFRQAWPDGMARRGMVKLGDGVREGGAVA
jgi:transposase